MSTSQIDNTNKMALPGQRPDNSNCINANAGSSGKAPKSNSLSQNTTDSKGRKRQAASHFFNAEVVEDLIKENHNTANHN